MYIGNVKTKNESGVQEVKGDAMLKSPVNRFDTFPSKSIVEAAVNDGESIVALEEFADRILQFKQNTLYIINVSQDVEFLEEVYKHKGVSQPSAVCKTDYGIAWVNDFGCYLYDGKKVINLIEKGGRQIIKDSLWQAFATNAPMIGYIPKKRQLLVVDDNSTTGAGTIFLYDMVTQSWVEGSSATLTSAALTNFVNDVNGDLVWSHTTNTGTMKVWSDASIIQSSMFVQTKDYDFGQPGVRKNLLAVNISYKGNASAVAVNFVSGNSNVLNSFNGSSTSLSGTVSYNTLAQLKPTLVSRATNLYSCRLRFTGTAAADFEINDISFVYRMKNIK
jgi:hypothetical protein